MTEDTMQEDSSHYEISLTAAQAFLAFVLLLFSLAAAFAFGVIIGKGDGVDRLVVRREPAVINEGSATAAGSKIVELGVAESSEVLEETSTAPVVAATQTTAPVASAVIEEDGGSSEPSPNDSAPAPVVETAPPVREAVATPAPAPAASGPVFVQVLSSSDQKAAEALAAKLIDGGFTSAYVEKVHTEGSANVFRVRIRYGSDAEARAVIDRLRPLVKTDPWIARQ